MSEDPSTKRFLLEGSPESFQVSEKKTKHLFIIEDKKQGPKVKQLVIGNLFRSNLVVFAPENQMQKCV